MLQQEELQTLSQSGYKGWPYIHGSRDVCFVWYERNATNGRQCDGLAWRSFSRTRHSGKLGKSSKGDLVPVLVPSRYYTMSIDELLAEAMADTLPKLRKNREWVGPFLYMTPSKTLDFGDHGTLILARKAPDRSAGVPLSYAVSPDLQHISLATAA